VIRTLQVVYGYLPERISRKAAERFILAHAAERGLADQIPRPPIARFWCREAPEANPDAARYMIGWTAPTVVMSAKEREVKALNDSRLITFPSMTHESDAARGATVN
jgi:hypothetical protein